MKKENWEKEWKKKYEKKFARLNIYNQYNLLFIFEWWRQSKPGNILRFDWDKWEIEIKKNEKFKPKRIKKWHANQNN